MIRREKTEEKLSELSQKITDYQQYDPIEAFSKMRNKDIIESICIGLWHLTDWIWCDFEFLQKDYKNKSEFRNHLYNLCKELKIMHDIANKAKHFELSRNKSGFSHLKVHKGNLTGSSGDQPFIRIVMTNHKAFHATKVIEKVLSFWYNYVGWDLKFYDELKGD